MGKRKPVISNVRLFAMTFDLAAARGKLHADMRRHPLLPFPAWWLAALLLLKVGGATARAQAIQISDAQALSAGKRIWHNECGGTVDGLTSWNSGEAFASLGIGHYIWYPAGQRGPFEESFPELVRFLLTANVTLPGWLREAPACPWDTREAFLRDRNGQRLVELRGLLASTVAEQARFSANRLEAALPKMLADVPGGERETIRRRFYRVAGSPNGVYALVDYVNFKGEGVLAAERYHDHGWGLLQVLEGMKDDPSGNPGGETAREFAASAARVLTERVANSPAERHEARWLPGWKSRVETYAARG